MATGLGIGVDPAAEAAKGAVEAYRNRRSAPSTQDMQYLAELVRNNTRDRSRTFGEVAGDTGLSLLGGAIDLGQATYGIGNMATLGTLDEVTGGFSGNFREAGDAVQGWQSEPLQLRREDANAAFDDGLVSGAQAYLSDPSLLWDIAGRAVPSLIPTVAAGGMAARTVGAVAGKEAAQKAATTAAIRTGGAQIAGSTNVEAVRTLREQDVDGVARPLLGLGAGLVAGIGGGAISRFTGAGALEGAVGRRLAGVGGTGAGVGAVKGAVGGIGREATEEALQSTLETTAVNAVAPDNTLGQGVGKAAVMGGIGGGLIGGPLGAYAGMANPPAPDAPARAADDPGLPNVDLFGREVPTEGPAAPTPEQLDMQIRARADELTETSGYTDAEAMQQATREIEPPDFSLAATPDEIDVRIRERATGLVENEGFTEAQALQQATQELSPQQELGLEIEQEPELRLTGEEQRAADLGGVLIQNEILFEGENGNIEVNPEQQALFDQATEGMTWEQWDATLQRIMDVRKKAREEGARVRQQVEETTRVNQQAGVTEGDIRSAKQVEVEEKQARVEAEILPKYKESVDEEGNRKYTRYDPYEQRLVTIDRGEAVRDARRVVEEQDARAQEQQEALEAEAREAARPVDEKWRSWLDESETFEVKKNNLNKNNKEWQRFKQAALDANIAPGTPEAGVFLSDMANELGKSATKAGVLGRTLGTVYDVTTDMDPVPATPATEPEQQVGTQQERDDRLLDPTTPPVEPPAEPVVDTPADSAPIQDLEARQSAGAPLVPALYTPDGLPFDNRKQANDAKRRRWLKDIAIENNVKIADLKAEEIPGRGWVLKVQTYDDFSPQQAQEQQIEEQQEIQQQEQEAAADPVLQKAEEAVIPPAEKSDIASQQKQANVERIQRRVEGYYLDEAKKGESRTEFYKRKGKDYLRDELVLASSMEELDTMYASIMDTPTAKAMSVEDKRELVAIYNGTADRGNFMRVNPEDDTVIDYRTAAQRQEDGATPEPPPSRSPRRKRKQDAKKGKGKEQEETLLTPDTLDDIMGNNPDVQFHQTVADYKKATGRYAPTDAAGVFDNDGVHAILSNIKTAEHLAEVIAHEGAHKGIRSMLGDRVSAVTNRLWANAALRERIRTKMRNQSLDRAGAAEEVLVDMIAANERLTGDVWTKIKSAVQATFESTLGVSKYRVTDRQVDALLDDVARATRGEDVINRGYQPLSENDFLDTLIGKPQAITQSQRFSRVMETLNRGRPDVPGRQNAIGEAIKEATNVSRTSLRDILTNIKSGQYGRAFLPFVPLNQIYNLYGRNFDHVITAEDGTTEVRNTFRDLNTLKGEQEARFNQRLARKRDIELDGETFHSSVMELSDRGQAFQRHSPEKVDDLNSVLQETSFFQVWPQKAWEDQPGINYKRYNMTPEERKAAWEVLSRKYNNLGTEGQTLYREMQASYRDAAVSHLNAIEAELRRITGRTKGEPLPDDHILRVARRQLTNGPYSPLIRHGDHLVIVRGPEGTEHLSGHDTQTEAEAMRVAMSKQYPAVDGFTVSRTLNSTENGVFSGLNQQQLDALESSVVNAIPEDSPPETAKLIRDALTETYLKMLPASSFGKFSNRRKNVSGYSMDGLRAYSDYSLKGARRISAIEYDGRISQAITGMQEHIRAKAAAIEPGQVDDEGRVVNTELEQSVVDKVQSQHQAALNKSYSKLASTLSGAGFLYMMTSPSQLFVNATQTFMVAMPRLAARYGGANTLAIGKEAMANFTKSGGDFLSEKAATNGSAATGVRSVMQRLFEDGTLDFTFSMDMTDAANGESGQLNATWRKTVESMSVWIHKSEVFNRQMTAYMATRMHAAENNMDLENLSDTDLDMLHRVAKDAVDSTQFNYSQSNKAEMLQGPVRRLVGQFQQYRLNMIAMMAKDIRDSMGGNKATAEERSLARKSLAYMLGTQLAFTGAVGTALSPIAFAIMDAFGSDDEDFVDSRTALLQAVPTFVSHGFMGGVLNMDPSRIEVGSVLPFLGDRVYAPKTDDFGESAVYYLEQNIGPWFGLTTGVIKGTMDAMNGDFYEASQGLLPKPFADPVRAWHERDGVRNRSGAITYDTGMWDSVNRALGMRSADVLVAQETAGAVYQATSNVQRARQNLLVEYATYHALGDDEGKQEVMGRIENFGAKNPAFRIVGQDIGRMLVNQRRTEQNVREFGAPTSRQFTPALQEITGIRGN